MIPINENYADKLIAGIGDPKNMMLALKLKGFHGFVGQVKNKLQKLGLKTKIKILDGKRFSPRKHIDPMKAPIATYDQHTDTILINKDYFVGQDMNDLPDNLLKTAISTLLHEIVHAYQYKIIKNLKTDYNVSKTGYLNAFIKGYYFAGVERSAWALTVALDLFLNDEVSMNDFNRWLSEGKRMAKRLSNEFDINYVLKELEDDYPDTTVGISEFDVTIHHSEFIFMQVDKIIKLFGWVKSDLDLDAVKTYVVACTANFFFMEYLNHVKVIVDKLMELRGAGLNKPSETRLDLTRGAVTRSREEENYEEADYDYDFTDEIRFFNTLLKHTPVQYNNCQKGIKLVGKYYNRLLKI